MKKIILDFDNTIGIHGCDVDDGLALLYLLGSKNAKIIGLTTTYGNSILTDVYENTKIFLKEIGYDNIPLLKGGAIPGDYKNSASYFLVDMANKYEGELSILATGSLTNLQGAYELDPAFFTKIKEIVLMGGITEPLVFQKKTMDELNFSCDPLATYNILTKGKNLSVITGNNCLDALFTKDEYRERLFENSSLTAKYIKEKTDYWFNDNEIDYGIDGFYNWDVIAAVYLMNPKLFTDNEIIFDLSKEDLQKEYLRKSTSGFKINLPKISIEEDLKDNIYSTWLSLEID